MKILTAIKNYFCPPEESPQIPLPELLRKIDNEIECNDSMFNICSDNELIDVIIYKRIYLDAYKNYVIGLMKNEL